MPVLDEAEALPALLEELRSLDLLGRTLFVDNGSSDGGPELIRAAGAALLREPRRGYGYPCLTGARAAAAAGARAVVFLEADGTDDPSQTRYLVEPVLAGVADLVIGSRRAAVRGAATGHMPLHQRLGNDWLALNLWLFFGLRLSDDGPFRAIRTDLLGTLRLEERALRVPDGDGGEGAPCRRAHRHPRHPLPAACRLVQDRRHLARLGARRARHLVVPAASGSVRLQAGAALTLLTRRPSRPAPTGQYTGSRGCGFRLASNASSPSVRPDWDRLIATSSRHMMM